MEAIEKFFKLTERGSTLDTEIREVLGKLPGVQVPHFRSGLTAHTFRDCQRVFILGVLLLDLAAKRAWSKSISVIAIVA